MKRSVSTNRSLEYPQVVVIIPAINEEQSVAIVLADLPGVGRVIVADNGSTDRTVSTASDAGAHVITETRRGYGSACLAGLAEMQRLIELGEMDPEIVVFLDADYSDHPDELPDVVRPIQDGTADLVIGSRLKGESD